MRDLKFNDISVVLDVHIPKFTEMIAKGDADAFLIAGTAGIGKTHGVEKTLRRYKQQNPQFQYTLLGGEISKIGLYKELYLNRNALIVFDDIDAIFSSDCANILKNALNTKENRTVSYLKNNKELFNADGMTEQQATQIHKESGRTMFPKTFQFNGRCIFISNKSLDNVDSAVRDRCIGEIFLDFNIDQIAQRISTLIHDLNPKTGNLDINQKFEVLQHLYDSVKITGKRLTLRSFVNALSYRVSFAENNEWKQMVDLYLT